MSRDIDPALVEKAAHALHDAMCCDGIYPCKEPVEQLQRMFVNTGHTNERRAALYWAAEQVGKMREALR